MRLEDVEDLLAVLQVVHSRLLCTFVAESHGPEDDFDIGLAGAGHDDVVRCDGQEERMVKKGRNWWRMTSF